MFNGLCVGSLPSIIDGYREWKIDSESKPRISKPDFNQASDSLL